MEFVAVQPSAKASAQTKKQINRHIARTSHRRSRQALVDEHQKTLARKGPEVANQTSAHRTNASLGTGLAPDPATLDASTSLIANSIWTSVNMAPFGHLLSATTPKEQFMLQYYAIVVLPYLNLHCPVMQSMNQEHYYYRSNWIFYASQETDFYRGFFLSSCRHLSLVKQEQQYADLATEYKLQYLGEQRRNVALKGLSAARSAIITALILGYDELMLGDIQTAFKHILGAAEIIKEAGGIKALGLSKFIRHVLYHCLQGNRLMSWDPLMHCSSSFMKPHIAISLIKSDRGLC